MSYIMKLILLSCTLNNGEIDYECVDKKIKCIQESKEADDRDAARKCI